VEGGEQDEQYCQDCLHILPVPEQTSDTPVVEDLQLGATRSEVRQQQKSYSQPAAEDLQSDNKSGKHQGEAAMETVVEPEYSMENSMFESLRKADITAGLFLRSEHNTYHRGRQMLEQVEMISEGQQSLEVLEVASIYDEIPELEVGEQDTCDTVSRKGVEEKFASHESTI
jgi:hypothetical protein